MQKTRITFNETEFRAIGSETSALTSRRVTSGGSASSGSVLTCGGGAYLHFTLKLSRDWSHRAIEKAVIKFRQSSGSGTEYGIVESTEGWMERIVYSIRKNYNIRYLVIR